MAMVAKRKAGVLEEINVTPFADVIVVLLIIFMLVAPVLTRDPALTLPGAVNGVTQNPKPLIVAVQRDGRVRVAEREVSEPTFRAAPGNSPRSARGRSDRLPQGG